jgi:preprotein translocase subunit Sec63
LAILFLFFGLYYFSTFFISLAIWFFKRKIFFDLIMELFKKKDNSSIPLSEAYDLLGIDENASIDNINKAHKELITRLHPDKGGSSYLSARINEARDIIMNERMNRGQKGER